jgi:hypothetical protein
MCFVFVFCLSSAVEGATPIDVNNFSFEFDSNDGNQIVCHVGLDGVRAWEQSGSAWVGVDPYCLGDVNYDANYLDAEICEYCGSTEGCHCWPATHGICWSYIQATDRTYLYQELDPNDPNAIIAPGRKYTLTYDSMSEIYQGVLDVLSIYSGFFYGQEEANHVDISSTSYVLPVWVGEYDEPGHLWTYDLTLEWVCPPGHPDINEVLGLKFWTPSPGGSVRAYAQVDNVRLEWSWATEAYNPSPADGEKYVDQDEDLTWTPGLWAANTSGHILYYGTDWADVNDRSRTGGANQGILDTNSFDPGTLELGGTYYWTITEVNDSYVPVEGIPNPPWVGDVWSFAVEGRAANPSPEDRATDVSLYSVLKWEPGTDSESHDVYFGTDFDEVNEADDSDPNVFVDNYDVNYCDPPGMFDLGQTYYWRIDELRNSGADVIKGYIWSFTVAEYLMIDDMESYGISVNKIDDTWEDQYTSGNDSTAEIYLEIDDANYIRGEQSMWYSFENSKSPYYAETSREFDPAQDLTAAGFKVLTLYFRADMTNEASAVQPMYVFVSDGDYTGTVEYDDPNDLIRGRAGWQEWNIDLQDFVEDEPLLDLSSITSMGIVIGDGNEADDGVVYIDDVSLYPTRCVVEEATGSFTNDCDVDVYDLAVLASDWLLSGIGNITASAPSVTGLFGHWTMNDNAATSEVLDISGNGNHGVFYDDVVGPGDLIEGETGDHSVAGVNDLALEFDGIDDHVKIPALDVSSNTITIAAWVKRAVQGHAYDGIVMSSNNYDPDDEIPGPNYTAGLQFGSDTSDWSANYELSFMWTGYSWEWHTGLFVPSEEWTFTALSVAPEVATLYLYDGMFLQAARKYDNYEPLAWNTSFHIADQMQFGPPSESERFFPGAVDDVRIYNRTLAPEEILYLALQGPGSWYLPLEPWRANANDDDIVDLQDYAIMADNWLTEVLWP